MKVNEGTIDRAVRYILAATLAGYGMMTGSWIGLLALIPLGTAVGGWCPLYQVFGFNTCPATKKG